MVMCNLYYKKKIETFFCLFYFVTFIQYQNMKLRIPVFSNAGQKSPHYFEGYLVLLTVFQSCYPFSPHFLADLLAMFCGTLGRQHCPVVKVSGPILSEQGVAQVKSTFAHATLVFVACT